MTLTIVQGATRYVLVKLIRDAKGAQLDPTGWAIHAVIRRDHVTGLLVATWRSTPGAGEGLADVINADPDLNPGGLLGDKWIRLTIPPAMSSAWTWSRGVLHAEITEPSGSPPQVERIIDEPVYLDPEAVT